MLKRNNGVPDNLRYLAGTFNAVGSFFNNGQSLVIANGITFGRKVGRPYGYNYVNGICLPIQRGGFIKVTLFGEGSVDATISSTANLNTTLYGEGDIELGMNLAFNMYADILGEGSVEALIGALGNMFATLDAGSRPSAFDIAQEIWNAQAVQYNNTGTMGQKLNLASSGGVDLDALKDAVWNAVQTDYTTDGTFGKYLDQAISQIDVSQSSAGINASVTGFTLTNGIVVTGTYTDARSANGVYHRIDDDGSNIIDIEYQFNIGKNAVPSQATFLADLYNKFVSLNVFAWNYTTLTWEQIGTRVGDNDHIPTIATYNLLQSHVGMGIDAGNVRIRFYNTGLGTAEFSIDQLLITYAVISRSVGFQGQVVSGDATHVVLGSEASSVDNYYKPGLVTIVSGTGADQYGRIESYYGSTRTITIAGIFEVPPDSTSFIQISPWGSVRVSDIDNGIEILEAIKKKTNMIPGLY